MSYTPAKKANALASPETQATEFKGGADFFRATGGLHSRGRSWDSGRFERRYEWSRNAAGKYEWRRLGQDIQYLKHVLELLVRRRTPGVGNGRRRAYSLDEAREVYLQMESGAKGKTERALELHKEMVKEKVTPFSSYLEIKRLAELEASREIRSPALRAGLKTLHPHVADIHSPAQYSHKDQAHSRHEVEYYRRPQYEREYRMPRVRDVYVERELEKLRREREDYWLLNEYRQRVDYLSRGLETRSSPSREYDSRFDREYKAFSNSPLQKHYNSSYSASYLFDTYPYKYDRGHNLRWEPRDGHLHELRTSHDRASEYPKSYLNSSNERGADRVSTLGSNDVYSAQYPGRKTYEEQLKHRFEPSKPLISGYPESRTLEDADIERANRMNNER